jgi:hypothetical protein
VAAAHGTQKPERIVQSSILPFQAGQDVEHSARQHHLLQKGNGNHQYLYDFNMTSYCALSCLCCHCFPTCWHCSGEHSEAWQLVGPYLRLYGRSAIANSQLQNPEFQHFFIPGVGSLPYVVADIYHRVIVSAIGDPLCHESKWGYITELFMKEFPDAFFYHISEKYAKLLADLGYWVNDVGAETTLQVCGVGCSSGLFRPTAPCAPCRISSHGQVAVACKIVAAC